MTRLLVAAAGACAALAAGSAHAQLFKCVQGGRTVYQQEKCPETAKESRIREPDPVPEKPLPPKAAAEKAEREATAEVDSLVDVIAGRLPVGVVELEPMTEEAWLAATGGADYDHAYCPRMKVCWALPVAK